MKQTKRAEDDQVYIVRSSTEFTDEFTPVIESKYPYESSSQVLHILKVVKRRVNFIETVQRFGFGVAFNEAE